jgi:hypothetical protein
MSWSGSRVLIAGGWWVGFAIAAGAELWYMLRGC